MVFFDLPTITKENRKEAAEFRNHLLDDGFLMMQYSVYARPTQNKDEFLKHRKRIYARAPIDGIVQILFITDQQWATMGMIYGPTSILKNRIIDARMPLQLELW